VTYTFVTVTDAKFFRFESVAIDARTVNIVTVEKTLVDCADHPEYCGGILELAKGLSNATDLDAETLAEQLLDLGNGAAIKRIVYLTDILDIDLAGRDKLVEAFTTGYSKLDPAQGDEGTHSSEYRLILNVAENTIRQAVSGGI